MDGVVNVVVLLPPARTLPPVEAAYQSIDSPEGGIAEIFTVPVPHRISPVPVGASGEMLTVKPALFEVMEGEQIPVTTTL